MRAMFGRILIFLGLSFVTAATVNASAPASDLSAINYTLRFTDATQHYLDVEADIPTDGQAVLTLFMPVWTPGSYLVREYARSIIELTATSANGAALATEKSAKNRWSITTQGADRVRVRYRLFGREVTVRGNWIESDFAMLNGAPTFVTVADNYQRPYSVRLELPANWRGSYTPLAPGAAPHTYTAPDFDTLVDSPILAGSPQVDSFEVDGVPHTLVTLGGEGVWDNARVARSLATLVEYQRKFWGGLPYRSPYFFFNLLTGSRSGLEHKSSVVITADRWLSRTTPNINSWLSLASHEYFHAWNGKRLRPVEHGPFAYEHEVYTKSLWVVEGITSYYQHILLRRAGFNTRAEYLGNASGLIAGVQKTPGRTVQSLSEASYDAWIKTYRPDENSVNTTFSYYSGGALAAMLFDVEIRRASHGTKSLDDVMLAAYARYSGEHGYTEEQFIALASEIAGADLSGWVRSVVQTPGEWNYQPMLDWYGLEFQAPAEAAAGGWLGADTKDDNGRLLVSTIRDGTPAALAGLYTDDEILALDQYRVGAGQFAKRLEVYAPGTRVELLISRRGRLLTLPVTLGTPPRDTWRLKVRADATPAQKAHLEAWIGSDETPAALPAGS